MCSRSADISWSLFLWVENVFCASSSSSNLVCSAHCTLTPYLWNRLVLDKIDFAEQRESNVSIKARALWSSAQNIKHGQFQLSAWSPTVSYLNAQFFHIISLAFGWRLLRTADMCSTPGHKPMSNVWLLVMLADQSVLVHKGQENLSVINKVKWIWPHQVFNPDARCHNDFETDCYYRWWQMCRLWVPKHMHVQAFEWVCLLSPPKNVVFQRNSVMIPLINTITLIVWNMLLHPYCVYFRNLSLHPPNIQ